MIAYAQTSDQSCTASHPCAKICGDHVCAPGEVYPPVNQTTTTQTGTNTTKTNQTESTGITGGIGIKDNVTAIKNPSNMTIMTNATKTSTNMTMTSHTTSTNATVTTSENMTAKTTSQTPKIVAPKEQVASGTQPKDVKCMSGFELVVNQFNSRPACVKSEIASLLVERGWGMLVGSSP